MNDFTKSTLANLAKKGIQLIGITAVPDMSHPMPWTNPTRVYLLNDNGTSKGKTYPEMVALIASI